MNVIQPEPWVLTGAVVGAGVSIEALASESRDTAPWLLASTVLLVAGIALFVVLLLATPIRDDTREDTAPHESDPRYTPPRQTAAAVRRRALAGIIALTTVSLLAWSAGTPAATLIPAGLMVGGALTMLVVRGAW
ncbi:hypothetical protein [Saccharopolyspora phatthalungensis]|uniref:Uncharacterized protein n=1 Tax=Saccharopolyspora phatthalungensis TaxID=664693 RepID=A0A840QFW7_9PSEU|nr:hypothetical protein [Saccharopolyspora phatthalungensis]MBB5157499.1 hypothetical protein [Saccharopolyspora phatthalungensis]